jgi:peptide/nickel transport system permease protein
MPETAVMDQPDGTASTEPAPERGGEGQFRAAWRYFRKHRLGMIGLYILVFLYILTTFADFIAPYGSDDEVRDLQWAPPTSLHFSDESGFNFRPFIYPVRSYIDENFNVKQDEDHTQKCYLHFFVNGDYHRLFGIIPMHLRLFGFDPPKPSTSGDTYYSRYYLMGADFVGRDIFSRICYGGRISMSIGLVGELLVLIIGLLVGGISGYVGGITDDLLQRLCELLMLLPGFYLLLMLRFMFPSNMDSVEVYFAVITILALVGWPGLARVIRGMVLSIKTQDYVHSARAIGLRPLRIIVKHVLPNTAGYVIVTVTLGIPGYILGESALSLLGLGIMEPTPSWGNMLQKAMDIIELDSHPWVLWPGLFIFLAVMGFNLVGDGLRDSLDPKRTKTQ